MSVRWTVERDNSRLKNLGQMRRNSGSSAPIAWLAQAASLIISVKLVKWSKR
jgi:hypothetical protein